MNSLDYLEEIKKDYGLDGDALFDLLSTLSSIAYDNDEYAAYDFINALKREVES